jgi:hypothetical protein
MNAKKERNAAAAASVENVALATLDTEKGSEQEAPKSGVEHEDIRQRVIALRDLTNENYWDMALVLHEVYEQNYYRGWGFDTFVEYVDNELEFGIRKSQYLVSLQTWFNKMPPAIQKWMRSLGWTKARMLMSVVTPENAAEWRNRVDGKSVSQIEAMMKSEAADSDGEGGSDTASDKPKALTIKGMHPEMMACWEQAARHAGELGETDKPCQQLNLICIDYLATTTNLMSKHDVLRHMEKTLGLKIIAMRDSDDSVVFGGEYIEAEADADADVAE